MILIDTSARIAFFRGADPVAGAVEAALDSRAAAICGPVEAELRRGLRDERERKLVFPLLQGCLQLEQPPALWSEAGDLGFSLERRGLTTKTLDLLFAVYALSHSAALLTIDTDFAAMKRAGMPLLLIET